jgi:hypothetical protein
MLETNIRIVAPGPSLYVWTRRLRVEGPNLTPELLQRACNRLRIRHGLAATPDRDTGAALIVAATRPVHRIHLADDDWELEVVDDGEPARQLSLAAPGAEAILQPIIERALLARVQRCTTLWTLDSPRIWYESEPFRVQEGVAAFRRFEIATIPVDGTGIGIAVDVGTAFFSAQPLSYFLDETVTAAEQRRREAWLTDLLGRQEGQKGTLLYDNGRARVKCYFESAPARMTCSTTSPLRVRGRSYSSLYEYYRSENPELTVNPDTPAVRVLFPGLRFAQPVAADRVCIRVMNDDVPESLAHVDKIVPAERRSLIESFWNRMGPQPLGRVAPGMLEGFWRPPPERVIDLALPTLRFGQGRSVTPPADETVEAYRVHYRQRAQTLERAGCYDAPPSMLRRVPLCVSKASLRITGQTPCG